MKTKLLKIIIGLIFIHSCSNREVNSIEGNANNFKANTNGTDKFEFSYIYAGLGSGMGKKGPKFKVIENKYFYTIQQNSSSSGKIDPRIDTTCQGEIRSNSIDSIKTIVRKMEEDRIYETNSMVMSGGIHNLTISFEKKRVNFTLHNASHPTAKEIVEIINSNIPLKCNRLSLWGDLDERKVEGTEWVFPVD